jgi:lipopolysaccharide export system protein LptC
MVRALKVLLPLLIGLLAAYLVLAPLKRDKEISFILDKNKVDTAKERMRVQSARYQGQDNVGRPFQVSANQAVQARSNDPIVQIRGMAARIELDEGPAAITAGRGEYDMDKEQVNVIGPVLFSAYDGYRLQTRDVVVDMKTREMTGSGRVEGRMPLGTFSADKMTANLPDRRIVLTGRTRLHIDQGALR